MVDLGARVDAFVQSGSVPHGVLDALGRFVDTEPRQVIAPTQGCPPEELEERMELCKVWTDALVNEQPSMRDRATSVLWSLVMAAPVAQLRSFVSTHAQCCLTHLIETVRTRLGILLKTFLANPQEATDPPPHTAGSAAEAEKCRQRDGGSCIITSSATPDVCHVIPLSATKRKRLIQEASHTVIAIFWGEERNHRLQVLISDDAQMDSPRNAICLSPLLHHWWRRAYVAFEPLEKLHNGTRIRLRWLRRTAFTVWDEVPLNTDPTDLLHPPSVDGSLNIVDSRSGHPVLDGSVFDLTSDDTTTEVSYDLLELQWDLLRMAVLCGAVDAVDDPAWDPEEEDPVYAANKLMRELELEEEQYYARNPHLPPRR